ncbi:MAG: NAD(P)H-binding protein [Cyclobacteriaceae bacterium]|nr:NAD(P)H-binding protein [Cyclobacteriaceae bacterium]
MKIGVIGATGMLGQPVAKALATSGFRTTALVRSETMARKKLPPSIKLVVGDLKDLQALEKFIQDQDAVYLNLNLKQEEKPGEWHAEREGLQNILSIARKYPVKRIAMISSLVMFYQGMNNFEWWVFRVKKNAVEMVKESGMPFTIFYPSTFMENFRHTYRQGNRILLAGESKHKMWFIAANDFAKQVVKSFEIFNDENREYSIQGPEAFTAEEAATEYVSHYPYEKLSISKAPLGLLKFLGKFSQKINYGYHIVNALNNYPEKFVSEKTWQELGKPATTLREFARQT